MDKSVLMIELPLLNDEAIVEIHGFIQELMEAFESHYYHQLTRYYKRLAKERNDE